MNTRCNIETIISVFEWHDFQANLTNQVEMLKNSKLVCWMCDICKQADLSYVLQRIINTGNFKEWVCELYPCFVNLSKNV